MQMYATLPYHPLVPNPDPRQDTRNSYSTAYMYVPRGSIAFPAIARSDDATEGTRPGKGHRPPGISSKKALLTRL